MRNSLIVEFVGTFILLAVILATGEALPIAIALATVIYLGGATSGGHFNPAVSTMLFLKGDLDMVKLALNETSNYKFFIMGGGNQLLDVRK